MLEQDTAWELISEASKKLTEALQQGQGNVQSVKVAQVMLSAGNEKLNAGAKQLADKSEEGKNFQQAASAKGESTECRRKCCDCTYTTNFAMGTQACVPIAK